MIKSMTGYGISEFSIGNDKFSLEIKGVNHRFIEINIKSPDRFSLLENKLREAVKQFCFRGCFYVSIVLAEGTSGAVKPNIPLARNYFAALQELKVGLGLKQEIDIALLLKFKDIFTVAEATHDMERDWNGLKSGLDIALKTLVKMREEEGSRLANDIVSRLGFMEDVASKMEVRAPIVAEIYREKLKQKMTGILGDINIDEARLLTEAAIFADKCSIAEEMVRLKSHLAQFKGMLRLDEPVGRKMDFLCQEVLRELNTIGSKANDFELANLVVSAKAELEKIREQVQNVE